MEGEGFENSSVRSSHKRSCHKKNHFSRNPYTIFSNTESFWWSLKKIKNGLNHNTRVLPDGITTVHAEPTIHLPPMRFGGEMMHPISLEKKLMESMSFEFYTVQPRWYASIIKPFILAIRQAYPSLLLHLLLDIIKY